MGLKKGQIYEGIVCENRFPNKGIIRIEDQTVMVKDALAGQKVSFRLSKKRQGTSEGKLVEVLDRSPMEDAIPVCELFGQCGGCSYQRLSYDHQLQLKSQMVRDLISKVYDDFEFEGITGSPDQLRYRNKMEFSFGDECKDGPFALGLHRKGSFHDIVNIHDCLLVHQDINTIRNAVREYFNDIYLQRKIDFNHQFSHRGYLRHLLVRRSVSTGELLVALITTTPDLSDCLNTSDEEKIIEGFLDILLSLELTGSIAGICHVYNNAQSDVVKNEGLKILYGRDSITETILGLQFRISLFSFFQTNSKGAEVLYSVAREFAGSEPHFNSKVIYDLYSGTGTITQLMSPGADRVIGIEIVEDAVNSARENARLNNIDNVEFIAGDVMKILCQDEGEELPLPDLIILDPPREGIHPKALRKIAGYGVDNIVYISCKPTSLVNDLVEFKNSGYRLVKAACVDMFPMTVHVETVCLLSNRKPNTKVRIDVDLEDYYRIKDSKKNQN